MSEVVTSSPLAETLGLLDSIDEHLTFHVGIPNEGWIRLDKIDEGLLASWLDAVQRRCGDRQAAAATVGGWLGYLPVVGWAAPAIAAWRLPRHHLGDVAIRMGEEYPDGIAYADGSVGLRPEDPLAGYAEAEVIDSRDEFLDRVVQQIEQVSPLFDRLRRVARIGKAQLWGEVADSVGSTALWIARDLGRDQSAAWTLAMELVTRLKRRNLDLRAVPKPFPVPHIGGEALFQVRGTCCLYYRTCTDPDPEGDGYCTTCPLRTDDSRLQRLRIFVERDERATAEGES